ncbi:TldD/PmbA family protein [Methanococcus voltae]
MMVLNLDCLNVEKIQKLLEKGTYADIRVIKSCSNNIVMKDGDIDEISSGNYGGVIVRVLENNGWGLATSNDINMPNIEELFDSAYKSAKLSDMHTNKEVIMKEVPIVTDKLKTKVKINPLDISVEEKKEYMNIVNKNLSDENNQIVSKSINYSDAEGASLLLTSEGTCIESEGIKTLMRMMAVSKGESLQFAFDKSGGDGFEAISEDNLEEKSIKVKERALRLLSAKPCPKGEFNVVLDPELAGVFIHEAVGHATEADLVLSNDSVFKNRIGDIIGSEEVTVIDDPTIEGSFGFYKYDNEGVKGAKSTLIENGVLKGYLHSRETAGRLGMDVTGNSRAQALNKPIVRMSNTYIKSKNWKFDELIEDTKDGIYLIGSRGGQVDTGKGLFQFNSVEAFMIENGELTTSLKDAGLSGEIMSILHDVNAVTDDFYLSKGYCGKGGQSVPVGDGGGCIRTKTTLC